MQEGFWANIERQHTVKQSEKPSRREELKHTTSFGLLTRSKNEALIAELLHAAGIEFYYEKRLQIVDEQGKIQVIYPDFTIILADGSVIYWEHKGMMADPGYEEMDRKRMRLYFFKRNLSAIEFDCNHGWTQRGVLRHCNQHDHRPPSGSDDRKQILAPSRSHAIHALCLVFYNGTVV